MAVRTRPRIIRRRRRRRPTVKARRRPRRRMRPPVPRRGSSSKFRRRKPRKQPKPPILSRHRRSKRRRRRRPFPWWHYPYPPWFAVDTRRGVDGRHPTEPPPWANRPGIRRYSRGAQSALWRHDLLRGVWIDRLVQADDRLVQFVNRFYRSPGFHYVVRDYFNGHFKRNMAQLAMRLASRFRDPERTLRFERSLTFAPGGTPVRGVKLMSKGIDHIFNPWPRIDGAAMRQQFRRSVALYRTPQNVRWVFDGTRLRLRKRAVVDAVRRTLRPSGSDMDVRNGRAWLKAIDRLVVVV